MGKDTARECRAWAAWLGTLMPTAKSDRARMEKVMNG